MVWLTLHGRAISPDHAALLADVRRCKRCGNIHPHDVSPTVRVPRVRVEQSVRELEQARR